MTSLWLITQSEQDGYDTYDSAVVVADSSYEAVRIHPSDCAKGWDKEMGWYGVYNCPVINPPMHGQRYEYRSGSWASSPEGVSFQMIGQASEGLQPGTVVCTSYNAG